MRESRSSGDNEEAELVRRASIVALRRTSSNDGILVEFDETDDGDLALVRRLSSTNATNEDEAKKMPLAAFVAKFALTGASAMTAETATFPVDLTKTRMQLNTARSSFWGTAKSIVAAEGVGGLYAGIAPAVVRHVPYSGIRVALYENLRKFVIKEGETPTFATKLALGFTSGGIAQTVAVPCDLVKIRMVADGRLPKDQRRYKGLIDAFMRIPRESGSILGLWAGSKPAIVRAGMVNLGELATYDTAKRFVLSTGMIVRSEGAFAMWKGFFPAWARLGPWQLTFWVTYEQLLKIVGMESF